MTIVTNSDTFSILDYLDSLNIVKQTATEYHCTCPLCDAGGFKIDKKTGKYNTFACGCMDTDEDKKAVIQAIAPLEPKDRNYESPRRQIKPKGKAPKLPPINEPITLAKFEVIPTDFPKPDKPSSIPNGIPVNASQITYRYTASQFVKRFDWKDSSKAKGREKSFRQCCIDLEGNLIWGKGSDPWPLYRESEVIAAKGWPLLQEGEKCVDTARCTLGLVSTTFQGSKWGEDAIKPSLTHFKEAGLSGLVFITDNDDSGEAKGKKVLSASAKTNFPVLIIPITQLWTECPEKGDLADWVEWGQSNGMDQNDFINKLEIEIHKAATCQSQKPTKDNVIDIDSRRENAQPIDLKTELISILNKGLTGSDLTSDLVAIAHKSRHQLKDVESLYNQLSNESEQELERDYKKQTLDKLKELESQDTDLSDFLPKELASPLTLLSNAYGTTSLALISHLLPIVCVCLDPSHRLMLRPATKQVAKPIFWIMAVGEPGSGKTPGNNLITDPYKKLQWEENERYKVEIVEYERAHKEWDKLLPKEKKFTPEPEPPSPKKVFFVDNVTIEKLLKIQGDQPDWGLLWNKDECSGLIDGLGQYKGGKGDDIQALLSMRSGEGFSVERVSKSLYSPHSTLSISGGIQPEVLKKRMGNLQDEDGFFSRFCFAFIGDRPNVITDGENIPDISPMLEDLYRQLRTIKPQTFKLSDDAQKFYNDWYNRLDNARRNESTGAMKAIYAKYKTVTGEIALALHCLSAAFYKREPSQVVELATIQAAQRLTVQYLNQIKVFYQKEGVSDSTPLKRILDIASKPGREFIDASEVKRYDRHFKSYSPDTIRSLFNELALMDKGVIEGSGKKIRFTAKIDNIPKKATDNRQIIDNYLSSTTIDIQGFDSFQSKKIDKIDGTIKPSGDICDNPEIGTQEYKSKSLENVYLSISEAEPHTQQGIETIDSASISVYSEQKPVYWDDLKAEINNLMEALGWDEPKGKAYLLETYGVKSRHRLSNEQVIDFLKHLKNLTFEKDFLPYTGQETPPGTCFICDDGHEYQVEINTRHAFKVIRRDGVKYDDGERSLRERITHIRKAIA